MRQHCDYPHPTVITPRSWTMPSGMGHAIAITVKSLVYPWCSGGPVVARRGAVDASPLDIPMIPGVTTLLSSHV